MTPATPRSIAIKTARGLRDFWMIIGIALALFIAIEIAYRAQSNFRHALAVRAARTNPPPPHNPFDDTDWWQEYWVDHIHEAHLEWEPYLYVRNPTFTGKIITIDSLGHRITPVPPSAAPQTLKIFFLGGSTTFGWFQRNDHTIPAVASARLQDSLAGRARVEATNFGVPGRVFTQEVVELILQLRAGARPDIVVFYDGINEVWAVVQDAAAGLPQNEETRADDFRRGREIVADNDPGLRNDRKWAARILQILADRTQFVHSIAKHTKRVQSKAVISTDSATRGIVSSYAGTAKIVEALAKEYGFQPIYVWQPALLTMRKPLSNREAYIVTADIGRPEIARIRDIHEVVPRMISDAMNLVAGNRFVDATDLFNADSTDVYEDVFGHTYERAVPIIVDKFLPQLVSAARRKLH